MDLETAILMCVLRVYGPDFDPETYLASGSHFKPLRVYVPGDPIYDKRAAKRGDTEKGFHVGVSNRPWEDWEGQIADATAFLTDHAAELEALRDLPEVTTLDLDFPTEADPEERHVTIWGGGFPSAFIRAAARAGVDVQVTLYFATADAEDGEGE